MDRKWRFQPVMIWGSVASLVIILAAGALLLSPNSEAWVQVVHASPDSPQVDVYLNGTLHTSGLSYTKVGSVKKVAFNNQEEVAVDLRLAGTSAASAPVFSAKVSLLPGARQILVIANKAASLQVGVYTIPTAHLLGSHGRVQVLNAIPGGPRVSIETGTGLFVIEGVGYLENPPWTDLPTGDYRLLGVSVTDPAVLIFDQKGVPIRDGEVTTFIITGPDPIRTIWITTRIR